MEEWLQTEWWDWQVYVANLTEHYAQFAVAGPKAREVLSALKPDFDVSKDALPFMAWSEGALGNIPARVFRISFSGELSFEVAVPASRGLELLETTPDAPGTPQDEAQATRAPKLGKRDGALVFDEPAESIVRRSRALWPWPGARCRYVSTK